MGGNLFGSSKAIPGMDKDLKGMLEGALGGEGKQGEGGGMDVSALMNNFSVDKLQQTAKNQMERMGIDTSGASETGRSIFAELPQMSGGGGGDSFASMLTGLVNSVDAKSKASEQAAQDLMLGKSDNIHQAMISMQEASISFDLLVQVRNKLVDSFKELSRMQA
jgi:flagellar hook-basal body complex protein FliE